MDIMGSSSIMACMTGGSTIDLSPVKPSFNLSIINELA